MSLLRKLRVLYFWFFSDLHKRTTGSSETGSFLIIEKATFEDYGIYICVAYNDLATITQSVYIKVKSKCYSVIDMLKYCRGRYFYSRFITEWTVEVCFIWCSEKIAKAIYKKSICFRRFFSLQPATLPKKVLWHNHFTMIKFSQWLFCRTRVIS